MSGAGLEIQQLERLLLLELFEENEFRVSEYQGIEKTESRKKLQ